MTGNGRSTYEERAKWLAQHPEIAKLTRGQIVAAMKKAGLVSPMTYRLDVNIPGFKGDQRI